MDGDVILTVPYADKDEAKALGARWNPTGKKWYVPAGLDPTPFERWIEDEPDDSDTLYATGHLYVVESLAVCWKCQRLTPVFCLASDDHEYGYDAESFTTYSDLASPPVAVRQMIERRFPSYHKDFSRTAGGRYYMNHCTCGAKLGDFYLHSEPGGAFFPTSQDELVGMKIHTISAEPAKIELDASPRIQSPNFIEDLRPPACA